MSGQTMGNCKFCGEEVVLPFQCSYCKAYFCNEHLPPHKHYCPHISQEDIISEIADKATLSETLLDILAYIARIAIYMSIMVGAVLAVDVVALWMLNLLMDMNAFYTLLFIEGLIMIFFGGVAGMSHHQAPQPWATPMGTRLYWIKRWVRYPWFWVSLGMAGIALWVLATYLFLHVKV